MEIIIIPKTGCVFTEGNKTYLEESMETWFLFLASSDGLLTHFKEIDKRWVGLHQLFRLGRRWRGRRVRDSRNGFMQYLIGPEPVGVYHFTESLLYFFGESGNQGHTCCIPAPSQLRLSWSLNRHPVLTLQTGTLSTSNEWGQVLIVIQTEHLYWLTSDGVSSLSQVTKNPGKNLLGFRLFIVSPRH